MAISTVRDFGITIVHKFYKPIALAVVGLSLVAMGVMTLHASAAEATTHFNFTQADLASKWGAERITPSGGYKSLTEDKFGRSNVVQIGIDSQQANLEKYYRTEGIKTAYSAPDNFSKPGNFGTSVAVDLYLDGDWSNKSVRAGLWTVGDNGNNGTDAGTFPFGILEFAHVKGYEGFRYVGSKDWVKVSGFKGYGKWVTFKISLDPIAHQYILYVDGKKVGQTDSPLASTYLYSVILNQRNFGLDKQANLDNTSYAAYWQGGIMGSTSPVSKDDCFKDGWKKYDGKYKNQGECASAVAENLNGNN